MFKRRLQLLFALLMVCIFFIEVAHAGRRGVRVDLGAWNAPQEINLGGGGEGACPEAGWDAQIPIFGGPTVYWGWVKWMDFEFSTSGFEGLDTFTCQTSKPYTFGADPLEYLNEAIFPADEADLGAYIGANTDNAVHAIRYSFTGEFQGEVYGRQWTFYFFSSGETVVGLYGVQPGQTTYEWIYYHANKELAWSAQNDPFWDGYYFCFYDNGAYFGGTCEPAPPPPPEEIFISGFEDW